MAKDLAVIPETIREIDSFEAAMQFAVANGELINVSDLGDGFTVIKSDDKEKLIGVPFVTVGIDVGQDDLTKRDYVVVRLVTKSGSKIIMTDGSTGIKQQIFDVAASKG